MRFYSKYRLIIIFLGIVSSVAFIFLGHLVQNDELHSSFYINMAAGVITISFTVAVVDWMLQKDKQISTAENYSLTRNTVRIEIHSLFLQIAELYENISEKIDYVIDANDGQKNAFAFINSYRRATDEAIVRIKNADGLRLKASRINRYMEVLEIISKVFFETLAISGFSMKLEQRNKLAVFRERIDRHLSVVQMVNKEKLSEHDEKLILKSVQDVIGLAELTAKSFDINLREADIPLRFTR